MVPRSSLGARVRIRVALLSLAALSAAAPSSAQTSSAAWTVATIGTTLKGSGSIQCQTAGCGGTVTGVGSDIGGTTDQFSFAYVTFVGDGVLVGRVDSLDRTDEWAKAGLMIRESLQPKAKHAFALVSPDHGVSFQSRQSTNGVGSSPAAGSGTTPVWLKLERVGKTFNAYRSSDGVAWTKFASDTIDMPGTVLAGLAVTSHNLALKATARFSGVSLTSSLPAPWQAADIAAQPQGATFYSSGTFSMQAAGLDIWGTSDQFRYTYQRVSGDVDVIARVSSIQNVDVWTKAGLMIRGSLSASAAHVSVFGTPGKGVAFQRRTANGGATVYTAGGPSAVPVWLKLERRGDDISAFRSADGFTWTYIGSETVVLPRDVYVGLALTSHVQGKLASASFDQVTVRPVATNAAPTVTLTAPTSGTTAKLGASVALAATASDKDGSVSAVDFLVNGTVLTSDASSPYTATWTPTVAGTFTVSANARDNAGAIGTSAGATVTIQAPAPRMLTFTPSPDDATLVDFYQVEFYKSGATTGSAVLVQSLGKPAVVGGQIAVDVSALLAQLPAGTYVAIVDAVGVGGLGRSDASPAFTR